MIPSTATAGKMSDARCMLPWQGRWLFRLDFGNSRSSFPQASLPSLQASPLRADAALDCRAGRAFSPQSDIWNRTSGGTSMADAQCACGALRLKFREPPQLTALCHCFACQRRTGAPFSANAFYAIDGVEISGPSTEFTRTAGSGRQVRMHFCPTCGSTVYWKAEASPLWIGVAIGAFADPAFTPPTLSVFEHSIHSWVRLGGGMEHFQALPSG